MKKALLASVAGVALLNGWANAADLARPGPIYRPAVVPVVVQVYNWTGCYVGGNVGGIWAMSDWNDAVLGDFGSGSATGALGGLQTGCNYQFSNSGWVVGIQGDYDWTNASNNNPVPLFPAVTDQTNIRSLASITGRVGYAFWDRFLGYVKAGGAWEQGDFSFQVGTSPVATASARQGGWTVGIGGEYAFVKNWLTGFVEYDYYRFSNANPGPLVCTVAACGFAANDVGITTNVNVLKAGLNFKFPGSF